ncbi:acyl-CoA thioesterase [Myxococcota bacterium]|nr:acyl-CoA thioesterase [Myxococcota bacterium]
MLPAPFPGLDVTVRSSHVDLFGHVSHMAWLEFMEWARFAWAEHVGAPIPVMIARDRLGPALVKLEVRYRQEGRLGDQLRVTVEPVSADRRLGRLRQEARRQPGGELCCEAEMTFVMIDLDTRRPRPLPAGWLGSPSQRHGRGG